MKRPHGGNKVGDLNFVSPVNDLIADRDVVDPRPRMERLDVLRHPPPRRPGVGQPDDLAVADRDSHGDPAAREGAEDVGVGVEELHAVDARLRPQEVRHLRRRRQVVAERAVVDADGVPESGGGGDEGAEEEGCGGGVRGLHGFFFFFFFEVWFWGLDFVLWRDGDGEFEE